MGVFDAIIITGTYGGAEVGEVTRPTGPLERGSYDASGWVPSTMVTRIPSVGFGVDSSGRPYFDTKAVKPGEEALLAVDGTSGDIWLEYSDE